MRRGVSGVAGVLVAAVVLAGAAGGASAATEPALIAAHHSAVVWLEGHQNADGSWGSGLTRPVATAEALLALSKAGRARGFAAQRAIGWLASQEYESLDHRARAVRALAAAGVNVSGLADFEPGPDGWGVVSAEGVTSYDSALVMAAIRASGDMARDLSQQTAELEDRIRGDYGFSGDFIPSGEGASDVTVTAEVYRAMYPVNAVAVAPAVTLLLWAPMGAETSTLEIAARLAALNLSGGRSDLFEDELLARMSVGTWGGDELVHATALLAIATTPGIDFWGGPDDDDDDDECLNEDDAFPQDPSECLDTDGDGIGDKADHDDDGDGVCEGSVIYPGECSSANDAFALDPTEWRDTDGDLLGDNADPDDDNDGLPDADEIAAGTDPLKADTDGDDYCDGDIVVPGKCTEKNDPCPAVADETDGDGDGVCTPEDACPFDPTEVADADGDEICDNADLDDDEDGWSDLEELAAGTDPRSSDSQPLDLSVTDPDGDQDGDGLTNLEERSRLPEPTSMYLADSDADGATDIHEIESGTDPLLAASQPAPVIAVFSAMSTATENEVDMLPESPTNPRGTVTGGQATPISYLGGEGDGPAASSGFENLAGFQPQTTLVRDLDLDGLIGLAESAQRTDPNAVDTDGDGFVDGLDGVVTVGRYPEGWNLNSGEGDFIDGEGDFGTDPSDADEHPGKPGDVAPLGRPDGQITAADATVGLRIAADPAVTDQLTGQNQEIAEQAADANGDLDIDAADALKILREAGGQTQ